MNTNLYTGELIRLSAEEPQVWAESFTRWSRDTEYIRLLDDAPAQAWSVAKRKQWLEKELEDPERSYMFGIRALADDQLIGFVGLGGIHHAHQDTWVGIGIGERAYWGKGYGSEAMRLILRYAFTELNLHRVSLGVFAYNTRAQRAYEKCGFKLEGIIHQAFLREGQRWDLLNMGILRAEWIAQNGKSLEKVHSLHASGGWMNMEQDLFTGKSVRLKAVDSQKLAEALSRWGRDSEYWRLLASDPARLHTVKGTKEWLEKNQEKDPPTELIFEIHTLDDDRLIGETGFDGIRWQHGDTFIGIGLGERDDWGKGYGTDAMQIMLRYAFTELNLHRVSLDTFEYNPRAIRSYEKVGFKQEGRARQFMLREGRRWDLIFMGITRLEWQANQNGE